MNTTSSGELHRELCAGADDQDEVDHDMRLGEENPGPGAAAKVPRVQMPAAVAPELTLTTGSGNCTVWTLFQSKVGRLVLRTARIETMVADVAA